MPVYSSRKKKFFDAIINRQKKTILKTNPMSSQLIVEGVEEAR